jgi:hypothetical protein
MYFNFNIEILELYKIEELHPSFDGEYGWLSIAELNCIDPNCDRFEVVDQVAFVDGSVFILVSKC